jgi:uncharacterized protein YfaQ (DUF2300 family)
MATTITQQRIDKGIIATTITMTSAGASQSFTMPACDAMSIQAESVTTGDVTFTRSNNGTDFYAMATPITFATADGQTSVAVADLGARYWKVSQTGAASSTLTIVGLEKK